jgi:hypothetical protein
MRPFFCITLLINLKIDLMSSHFQPAATYASTQYRTNIENVSERFGSEAHRECQILISWVKNNVLAFPEVSAAFSFSIENKNSSMLSIPSVVVFAPELAVMTVVVVETVDAISASNDVDVVVEVVVVSGATGAKFRR